MHCRRRSRNDPLPVEDYRTRAFSRPPCAPPSHSKGNLSLTESTAPYFRARTSQLGKCQRVPLRHSRPACSPPLHSTADGQAVRHGGCSLLQVWRPQLAARLHATRAVAAQRTVFRKKTPCSKGRSSRGHSQCEDPSLRPAIRTAKNRHRCRQSERGPVGEQCSPEPLTPKQARTGRWPDHATIASDNKTRAGESQRPRCNTSLSPPLMTERTRENAGAECRRKAEGFEKKRVGVW